MGTHFDTAFWALIALGAASAGVYGLMFLNQAESWPRAIVKTLMMAFLTAAFAVSNAPMLIVAAMAAAAFGDLFLAFDRKWTLPLGILSFLIAQIGYMFIFRDYAQPPDTLRLAVIALIVLVTIGFLIWMGPKLGMLALGVVPYSLAITAMACQAMLLPWSAWPAMKGAALFLISDFVLATELFRLPPDAPARRITTPVVWWTYAGAQLLIAVGLAMLLQSQGG